MSESSKRWPDDYDPETVALSGGTGLPAIEWAKRQAENDAAHEMLLCMDLAWTKAVGSVIGYDVDASGSITPEHMRQLVDARLTALATTLDEIAVALNDWYGERKAAHEKRAADWRKRQDTPHHESDGERWTYAEEHIRRDDRETLEPIRVLMRKADAVLAQRQEGAGR